MESKERPIQEVGVIIGRFQTPRLHKAHKELINAAFELHKKVIVLLGVAPIKLSKRDPLDYMSREIMLKEAYSRAVVLPVEDMPNDRLWSEEVDSAIRRTVGAASCMLYGSRDSFIPHYSGRYPVTELPSSHTVSATAAREEASREVRGEEAWRIGIIYATSQRFLISYQCTDAVIWRRRRALGWSDSVIGPPASTAAGKIIGTEILLGRKKDDEGGKWRFLGGFMDPVKDECLEDGARREAWEETGKTLTFASCEYVASHKVKNWRYLKESDKIMTAVFLLEYLSGEPVGSDDIAQVAWFDLEEVGGRLVEEHRPLWPKAKERLDLPVVTN